MTKGHVVLESNIWVLHDMSAQAESGSGGAALSIHGTSQAQAKWNSIFWLDC